MTSSEPAAWRRIATLHRPAASGPRWLALSAAAFFAFAYVFAGVLAVRQGRPLQPIIIGVPAPETLSVTLFTLAVLLVLVVVAHEAIHGLFATWYGGEPKYGVDLTSVGLPHAYAALAGTYTRDQLLVILLAPFLVLTGLGLVFLTIVPTLVVAVVLAANAAGSIADLWMAGRLLRYPSSVRIGEPPVCVETDNRYADEVSNGDTTDGVAIYGLASSEETGHPSSELLSSLVVGSVGTFAILVMGLLSLVLLSLAVGSGSVTIGLGDRLTLLRHDFVPEEGIALLRVDAAAIVAISALGGACWAVVAHTRQSKPKG
ncbi:DUF3267 domain-containing protein [Halobacteria archaeon AArc-dxtr1]|nr:DUF3267 domain-containing protein [Halobacteria archaeon AArc-dxtr1]